MWYLIRHKATGRYLSATEFDYDPAYNKQVLSDERHAPMPFAKDCIESALLYRNINMNDFEVVRADITPTEAIIIDLTPYIRL